MDKKNKITKKQSEIIILLYRFRFLNRSQIQKLLNHKKISRINLWLKDLYDKKIIGRNYSKKLGENIKPSVYYLATKSKNYLTDQLKQDGKLMKRIYGEKKHSQKFIDHCILSADYYLNLKQTSKADNIHFYSKIDLLNHDYFPLNHPDAYIATTKGKTIKRYFFEIIDEATPRFVIRNKIKQYLEYYDNNTWQETTGHPFPKILLLCPNETIKNYLHKHIPQVIEENAPTQIDFFLSNKADIKWVSALQ